MLGGEGWADEDDMDNITHWAYCKEPSQTVMLGKEPEWSTEHIEVTQYLLHTYLQVLELFVQNIEVNTRTETPLGKDFVVCYMQEKEV